MLKRLLLGLLTFVVLSSSAQRVDWANKLDFGVKAAGFKKDGNAKQLLQDGKYIYIVNLYEGNITLGTTTLTGSNNRTNAFAAKYDTLGNFIWAKKIGNSNGLVELIGAEIGKNGELYVMGYFRRDSLVSGSKTLYRESPFRNAYIVKLNSSGSTEWMRGMHADRNFQFYDKIYNINFGDNLLFIGGTIFRGQTIYYRGTNKTDTIVPPLDGVSYWQAAIDSSGNIHHIKIILTGKFNPSGFPSILYFPKLRVISDSSFYLAIYNKGTFDYGNNRSVTGYDQFTIAKFSSPTSCDWIVSGNKNNAPNPFIHAESIEIADDGGVYFAGEHRQGYDIIIQSDTISHPISGFYDIPFTGKISPAGNLEHLKNYNIHCSYYEMAINSNQEILLTGYFIDSINVHGITYKTFGGGDMMFLNLDSNLNINWFQSAGSGGFDLSSLLTSGASPSYYFWGTYDGILLLGDKIYTGPVFLGNGNIMGKIRACGKPIIPFTFNGDTNLCIGQNVRMIADVSPPATFQWYKDSSLIIGEEFRDLSVADSGDYNVIITRQGCEDTSRVIPVTKGNSSAVTFSINDTVCAQGQIVSLSGGTPLGGYYFGNGVSDSLFNPKLANLGLNNIGYTRSNLKCSDTAYGSILVLAPPSPFINGQKQVCAFSNGRSYSANSNGLTYNWAVSGGTITSGQGTKNITINWGATGEGIITLTETNLDSCSTSISDTVAIDGQKIIGKISGDSTVCINSIDYPYSIGAASIFYNWTVIGGTIQSGQGSSTIAVEWTSLGQGSISVRLFNTCGIDSTFHDTVLVNPTPTYTPTFSGVTNLCENSVNLTYKADSLGLLYYWKLSDGGTILSNQSSDSVVIDWNQSGTFNLELVETNSFGCTNSSAEVITVDSSSLTTLTAFICEFSSYSFDGMNLNISGIYYDSLTSSSGCDSIVALNLTVLPTIRDSINVNICSNESFNFGGNSISTSGVYIDSSTTINGCDSIVYLNLLVSPTDTTSITDTICNGEFYFFGGQNITTSGSYIDSLTTTEGCDSIIRLSLVVNPITKDSISQTLCIGDSILFAGSYLTNAGTYFDTLSGVNTCDSIVSLNLSLLPNASSSINESICAGDSFSFNGNPILSAGIYKDTLVASNGCDSIITLFLSVTPTIWNNIATSICFGDTLIFAGKKLSRSGIYSDTLLSTMNCDSISTLLLSVGPAISDSITVKSDTLIAFQTGVGYQWMTCDTSNGSLTAISGATNKYFVTNDSNYYAVELTSLSCTDTSTCYQRDLLTNIAKQGDKASKIVVFPNPTNGTVYITTEKMLNKNTRIQLRDINGRTIYNSLLNESVLNFKLDLSPFSKGLYFLEIKNNELMKTLKVVKQ